MTSLVNIVACCVFLSSLGVCYSEETPKYSHVNVTFRFGLDEREFLDKLREAKVEFEEGRRDPHRHKVIQEYILKERSIPDFEAIVQKLSLSRTEYSKTKEQYVKLILQPNKNGLYNKLVESGLKLREIKEVRSSGMSKAYIVDVSLIPQIEAIAKQLGISKIVYDKKRLIRVSVTFTNAEAETTVWERLKKFGVHVEEIKLNEHEKWDQEYLHGKWDVEYFLEPSLLPDFAYAVGVTLL